MAVLRDVLLRFFLLVHYERRESSSRSMGINNQDLPHRRVSTLGLPLMWYRGEGPNPLHCRFTSAMFLSKRFGEGSERDRVVMKWYIMKLFAN
jgi:hypothetical protein